MNLTLLAGPANPPLAEGVARALGVPLAERVLGRFPDGELEVEVTVGTRGHDVYIVQPTSPPVDEHLLELLLLADACRRAGAARVTAVVPYFGYARQDRRTRGGEPLGARLIADLLRAGGLSRVVAVDLHTAAVEGCFAMPLEHLTAVPILADAARPHRAARGVVVSPDLGAVKLAERYGRLLGGLPVAIVHKTRLTGREVSVRSIVGEVRGLAPVVVDDMISTAGTIEAAVRALLDAGGVPDVTVVASHALLVGPAVERLKGLPLRRLLATDTVRRADGLPLPFETVSVAPLLAGAISRLHDERPLGDLLAGG